MTSKEYLDQLGRYIETDKQQSQTIKQAFEFGRQAHKGQKRYSGEPYFEGHCVPVSMHLAEIGMGPDMIVAGLLHDTLEDTSVSYQDIVDQFGGTIAELVDGVSKLSPLKYRGNQRHLESLRKFFVAISQDTRVVILKICDRWHNLETLEYLPKEKQRRIAIESIEVHGQLASRLGMGKLAGTINDLAFPYAQPEDYQRTKSIRDRMVKNAEAHVEEIYRDLLIETTNTLGYQPQIDRRIKGIYSLYKKLERKDWRTDDIYDLIAVRIIVDSLTDCYTTLGAVHGRWSHVPGRMKDYIASPKPNGYQSLHTAIFSGRGSIIEIQIRTEDMHKFAEYGVAAHHDYKQQTFNTSGSFDWISQLGAIQKDEVSPDEYHNYLRTDFFNDRIFALTPDGDVIDMPRGATVLDFAFAVHTDIGLAAQGGRINGKYVSLKTPLESEDIVEIVTHNKPKPSADWLDWTVTSLAQSRIRRELGLQRSPKSTASAHSKRPYPQR